MISLFVIGNKDFFYQIHQTREKTSITMSLIISAIAFVMILVIYRCENDYIIEEE